MNKTDRHYIIVYRLDQNYSYIKLYTSWMDLTFDVCDATPLNIMSAIKIMLCLDQSFISAPLSGYELSIMNMYTHEVAHIINHNVHE